MRYEKVMGVKNLGRTGWMLRGVPHEIAESVAEHTFEVSFLTIVISDALASKGVCVDLGKALKTAVVHDLPESVSGDIVKWSKDFIHSLSNRIDKEALKELGVDEYIPLINELSDCRSLEACIVKLADNLSTALQAARYVRAGYPDVEEIMESSKAYINSLINQEPLRKYRRIIQDLINELIQQSVEGLKQD